jgi:hypothetical protein
LTSFIGSVYIFNSLGGQWSQAAKIVAYDGRAADQFGWTVSLYGNNLVVGSPQDDDRGDYSGQDPSSPPLHPSFIIHSIGSVYLFHGEGNQWSQSAKILAEDALANAFYGYSVSLFELEMLASAYKSDDAGIDSGLMNPTSS